MARIRLLIRRNIILIVLFLLALAITFYELTKLPPVVELDVPRVPLQLKKAFKKSGAALKKSIERLMEPSSSSRWPLTKFFKVTSDNGFNVNWTYGTEFRVPLKNESACMLDVSALIDEKYGLSVPNSLDQLLQQGRHGVYLHLSSLSQAQSVLPALTQHSYLQKLPVVISAKLLQGPNVIYCRKEKLCPYTEPIQLKSLLSLFDGSMMFLGAGWTEYFDRKRVNQGYSWPMVVDMYELIREVRQKKIPVLYFVRAELARLSIPQLKWLVHVTDGPLVLEVTADDAKSQHLPHDIGVLRHFLPKSGVYLRIPDKFRSKFVNSVDSVKLSAEWMKYEESRYKNSEWKVVNLYDELRFVRSEESVVMYAAGDRPVYLQTLRTISLSHRHITYIRGRVGFNEDSEILKAGQFSSALKIFIDSQFSEVNVVGMQILIASSGYFSVSSYSTRRDVIMNDGKMSGSNPCYQFVMEVEPRGIDLTILSPIDCNFALDQKVLESKKIRLDISLSTKPFNIFIQPMGKEAIVVDQFSWIE